MDEPAPAPSNTTIIQSTPPRDMAQEGRDTLATQIELAPQVYASEATYQPKYAELSNAVLGQTLLGFPSGQQGLLDLYQNDIYPRTSQMQATALTDQRTADISDVESLGARAAAAFRSANPDATAALDRLTASAASAGPSDLEKELNRQALEDLMLGGSLSPQEQRLATMSARTAFADRGLATGKSAALAELLNLDQYSLARQNQRRGYAMDVNNMVNSRVASDRAFQGNVAQLASASQLDPFMTILGKPATAMQAGQAQFGNAQQTVGSSGARYFDPFNSYAADLYNTNFNAANAQNLNQANLNATLYGSQLAYKGQQNAATMGMIGSIVGGAMSGAGAAAAFM